MTSSPNRPDQQQEAARSRGTLVVGDDPVGNSAVSHLAQRGDVIFVGMGDSGVDPADEHAQSTLEIDQVTDLFRGEIDVALDAAIIATSQDSQNLLIVMHLQQEFDFEEIVVRVNDPQYIDAFADLSVDLIDVADIVGAALAQKLDRSTGTQ